MATKKPAAKVAARTVKTTRKKTKPTGSSVRPADLIINQTEMAEVLGITSRRLRQLEKEEQVITSEGVGKFRLSHVVQAYIAYRAEGATKKYGSESADRLREEKMLDIRLNRMRKDRELISLDEALSFSDELVGLFVSYLTGLPAEITGVPRERQRLHDIIDKGRLKLADRLTKKISTLRTGSEDPDAEDED